VRAPARRGAPVDMERMRLWVNEFAGYRHTVNEGRIDRWLDQFQKKDRDVAARTLDAVDFVGAEQTAAAFRSGLAGLDGWDLVAKRRRGEWRFVAFSVSAGESGDSMLHRFRIANNLAGKQFDALFIHKSELLEANLSSEDTVVFVDDFSGTGDQATLAWGELQELLPGNPKSYLVLVAASTIARRRIERDTGLKVVCHIELGDDSDIFGKECKYFSTDDKKDLLNYCTRADPKAPKGKGDSGFVIVFSHTCPNNSIPILHVRNKRWEGLFRRYD